MGKHAVLHVRRHTTEYFELRICLPPLQALWEAPARSLQTTMHTGTKKKSMDLRPYAPLLLV